MSEQLKSSALETTDADAGERWYLRPLRVIEFLLAGRDRSVNPSIRNYPKWGVGLTAVVALLFLATVIQSLAVNPKLQWDVVAKYFFDPVILSGVWGTLTLTIGSVLIAIIVGFVIAYMGESNIVAQSVARTYIWFFRGVPLLVQLLIWFNIALLIPTVTIGIPFTSIGESINTNLLISGSTAALLGLGLHEAAYMAEIVRSGIISVPVGQTEAALTLGLRRSEALRKIVFPQMLRVIVPPTGNLAISLMKASSLVAAIGGGELLSKAQFIYGRTLEVVPLLLVASMWYLVLVSVATVGQYFLEKKLQPGSKSKPKMEGAEA